MNSHRSYSHKLRVLKSNRGVDNSSDTTAQSRTTTRLQISSYSPVRALEQVSLDKVRKSVDASAPLNQPQLGKDDLLGEIINQIASIPVVKPFKKEAVSLRRPTEPRPKSLLTKDQKHKRKVASMKRLENKKLLLKEKMQ